MANLNLFTSGNTLFSAPSQTFVWNETVLGVGGAGVTAISAGGISGGVLATSGITSAYSVDARTALNALTFSMNSGNDTVYGGIGNDSVYAGAGNDLIIGGAGDDSIIGGVGADTFTFGQGFGNDILVAGGSDATDLDTVKFTNYKFADLTWSTPGASDLTITTVNGESVTISVNAIAAQSSTTFITTDKTFHMFEAANSGTTGADYIRDLIGTGASLIGNGGADTLVGGAGDDSLVYGATVASYNGGLGNNIITASSQTAAVTIDLTDSKITNITYAVGGNSNDVLRGLATNDTLSGGTGNDVLWSRAGNDIMSGALGNDTFYFAFGDGADTINSIGATAATDADTLKFVGVNYDQLSFTTTTGANGITVKYGDDSATITNYSATTGGATTTWITNDKTFHVINNGSAATTVDGTTGADYIINADVGTGTISGNGGADTLVGGAGDDVFIYNKSVVNFKGNGGTNDIVTASASSVAVTIDLLNTTLYSGIETARGGTSTDLLRGSTGNETLEGNEGRDNLWSNAGDDLMSGGAGVDTYWFAAGDGNDTINAVATAADGDVFRFKNTKFADMSYAMDAANKLTLTYGGDVLIVSSFVAGAQTNNVFEAADKTFHLFMDNAAATATGTAGTDYIVVGNGTTGYAIDGKAGADIIIAGAGDDSFVFNSNVVSIDGGAGANLLTASAATVGADVNLADARFVNIDSAKGSSYNDVLRGNAADNTLTGGSGNDHLWGRAGNDTMTGGAGADTYWFGKGDGTDTINDDSANALDTVKLYNAAVTSQAINAGNLELNLADGSKLVITNWESSSSKLNKFQYGANTYKLSNDAATWTKI